MAFSTDDKRHCMIHFFQGVLDRFSQIKPKIIFSVDAVIYNNKIHDHLQKLTKVIEGTFVLL